MPPKKQLKNKNTYGEMDIIGFIVGLIIGLVIVLVVAPLEQIHVFNRPMPAFMIGGILIIFNFVVVTILEGINASNKLISGVVGIAMGLMIAITIIAITMIYMGSDEYDFDLSWLKQTIGGI